MAATKAPVVLVTKDLNMQLKARAVGIECQDYLNDKVDPSEVANYEIRRVEVDGQELQRFASSGELECRSNARPDEVAQPVRAAGGGRQADDAGAARRERVFRAACSIPEVAADPGRQHLKPLNLGQKCLVDALAQPGDHRW